MVYFENATIHQVRISKKNISVIHKTGQYGVSLWGSEFHNIEARMMREMKL